MYSGALDGVGPLTSLVQYDALLGRATVVLREAHASGIVALVAEGGVTLYCCHWEFLILAPPIGTTTMADPFAFPGSGVGLSLFQKGQ